MKIFKYWFISTEAVDILPCGNPHLKSMLKTRYRTFFDMNGCAEIHKSRVPSLSLTLRYHKGLCIKLTVLLTERHLLDGIFLERSILLTQYRGWKTCNMPDDVSLNQGETGAGGNRGCGIQTDMSPLVKGAHVENSLPRLFVDRIFAVCLVWMEHDSSLRRIKINARECKENVTNTATEKQAEITGASEHQSKQW